jgi:hypothetical protein
LSIFSPRKSSRGRRVRLVACATAMAAMFGAACDGETGTPEALPTPSPSPTPIEQAPWRVQSYPAVAFEKLSKKERRRFRSQRPRVKALIVDVYRALFLERERGDASLAHRFSRRAARAFVRTRSGMPAEVTHIKTTRRTASVGIEVARARRALARVSVRARGRLDGDVIRIVHRAHLWLERFHGRWRVIAFEIDQGAPSDGKGAK